MPPSLEEIEACIRVLEAVVADRAGLAGVDLPTQNRLFTAAGRVSRPERTEQRLLSRALRSKKRSELRATDEAALARAGIRRKREQPVFTTPEPLALAAAEGGRYLSGACGEPSAQADADPPESFEAPIVAKPRVCYICKTPCTRLHHFYDQMCTECGDFNHRKRTQTADLRGRVAFVSGARVKIGYQAAIMLLRAGARVIVSTRFPHDAALRYAREPDAESFTGRLQIYGLDLRHTPSVEAFARQLEEREERLDFVLHNACQTVRRPSGFYRHLMQGELAPLAQLPPAARAYLDEYEALRASASQRLDAAARNEPRAALSIGLLAPAVLSQLALTREDVETSPASFPAEALDTDLQQVDLRGVNSWRLALHEVATAELLEVQLVNAIAPFLLNARLKRLMLRQRTFEKHIVNVSAMEGQFYRRFKTDKHPHTNMAKAALNMMTRTSAADYAKDGIFMNSVDTGWVTDEDVVEIAARKRTQNDFHPPLDIVDGAARIVDPIFDGINSGKHVWGQFLKDYLPAPW
jgi:NAD(P)-dependent dehydrogenase (short-subunit alcohol dehydrogenase family)